MRMIPLPEPTADLALLTAVYTERASSGGTCPGEDGATRVVVGAAIVADGRVLACARTNPPEVAGKWEFPGGKGEPGETDVAALVRECAEELAVRVEVGERVGGDVRMAHGRAVLRVFLARLVGTDQPQPLEHAELRWLTADELYDVTWLPADAPIVTALRPLLGGRPHDS